MSNHKSEALTGILIIILGAIFLLANFGILVHPGTLVGAVILSGGVLFFHRIYRSDPYRWWAVACVLFCASGALCFMVKAFWDYPDGIAGAVLLWTGSLVFFLIFLKSDRQWWALIPAGVFFTAGLMMFIDAFKLLSGNMQGSVFFLGISCTFFSLWSQHDSTIRVRWAQYPAFGCLLIAVLIFLNSIPNLGPWISLAVILISAGLSIIVRNLKSVSKK